MKVLYEDNHVIIVYKEAGENVQADLSGDMPLLETVKLWIKEKYHKPGNVFLGLVHRLDRPVAGIIIFARTSKALARLNNMFRYGEVRKTYWAIVEGRPPQPEAMLIDWIVRNPNQNKSYSYAYEYPGSKKAVLTYRTLTEGERYSLLEVNLMTGRHHQIRCQLSTIGCPIRGDLKYGAQRSNPDGGISLLSHRVEFEHPVSHRIISIVSPFPADPIWQLLDPENTPSET